MFVNWKLWSRIFYWGSCNPKVVKWGCCCSQARSIKLHWWSYWEFDLKNQNIKFDLQNCCWNYFDQAVAPYWHFASSKKPMVYIYIKFISLLFFVVEITRCLCSLWLVSHFKLELSNPILEIVKNILTKSTKICCWSCWWASLGFFFV